MLIVGGNWGEGDAWDKVAQLVAFRGCCPLIKKVPALCLFPSFFLICWTARRIRESREGAWLCLRNCNTQHILLKMLPPPHPTAQRTRRKSQNSSGAFRGAFSRLLKSYRLRQENASNNNNNNTKGKNCILLLCYLLVFSNFLTLTLSFWFFLLIFYLFYASTAR